MLNWGLAAGRRLLLALAGVGAAWALAGPAQAAHWMRAESPHFVVYGGISERQVRDYALMLEDFDSLLRALLIGSREVPPAAKLEVYLVDSNDDLRVIWPSVAGDIGGFYRSGIDGRYAVAVSAGPSEYDRNKGDDIVLHEYVHHFMAQYFPSAYPTWLSEGYAEYYSTADLSKKLSVGDYSMDRADSLQGERWMPVAELISKQPLEVAEARRATYYAEAWLLTHYLLSDPTRAKALTDYVRALRPGADPNAVWTQYMGETTKLDAALQAYMKGGLLERVLKRGWSPPAVTVTPVPAGEAAVILRSKTLTETLTQEQSQRELKSLREIEAKFTGDPAVELSLAIAEWRSGDHVAGDQRLDALIAKDPANADALRQRAINLMSKGEGALPEEAVLREAGRLLTLANTAHPDDYRTLYWYSFSRRYEAGFPSLNTYNVMLRAADLAPQVGGIRIAAAELAIMRKDAATAREMLTPVAADPHGGSIAKAAQALLEEVDKLGH